MVGAFFAFLPLLYGIDCRCLDKYKHPDKCKQFYQFIFEYRSKPCSFFVNMHYILVFHYLLMFIYSMRTRFYDITITLKAYSKMRRATDIISHNLSDRRSIFNACWWLNISNITGCFTACISVHFPAVELITQSGLYFCLALFRGCQGLVTQLQIVLVSAILVIVSFKTCQSLEQHVASTLT